MPDLIDVLAAYRLTRLVTRDTLTEAARDKATRKGYHSTPWRYVGELLGCPWCVGFWCCAFVVAARRLAPRTWDPLARALAASTVVGLVATRIDLD